MHFGEKVKKLRTEKSLYMRQLASMLEIDISILSKIEKGSRLARREHVIKLAEIFEVDINDLLAIWLADKIYEVVKDEQVAFRAINITIEKLEIKRKES